MQLDLVAPKSNSVLCIEEDPYYKGTYLVSVIQRWGIYPKEVIQNVILLCQSS